MLKYIDTQDSWTIDDHVDLHYEHQFNYFNLISVKSPVSCQFGIADDSKQYSDLKYWSWLPRKENQSGAQLKHL